MSEEKNLPPEEILQEQQVNKQTTDGTILSAEPDVDVFTLIRTGSGPKIINASYSKEPKGCALLQKQ